MERVEKALQELAAAIRESGPYLRYQGAAARKKEDPEREGRIDDFRKRNFALQNGSEGDLQRETEQFCRELAQLNQDPVAAEFLAAELELCRMLQGICNRILDEAAVEIPGGKGSV